MIKRVFQGFTFIELLLVLLVIAVLASLTLSAHQQRLTNIKVEKTALQMQQIVQAALAYQRDQNCWPNNCTGNVPNFNNYLPLGNQNNPWGAVYIYQQDPHNSQNFLVSSGQLPTLQIANRIQSLLPNAEVNPNNNQVVLSTSPLSFSPSIAFRYFRTSHPLTNGDCGPDGLGSASQNCTDRPPVNPFSFTCPAGWTANALVVPTNIEATKYSGFWPPCRHRQLANYLINYAISHLYTISYDNNQPVICRPIGQTKEGIQYSCTYIVVYTANRGTMKPIACTVDSQVAGGYVQFLDIGYCVPPSSKQGT